MSTTIRFSNKKVIDIESLKRDFDEDMTFILEIITEYFAFSEESIKKLLNTYKVQDWNEMLKIVHSLKGSSLTVHAEEMSTLFITIENRLRDEQIDGLEEIILIVPIAFNRVKEFISGINNI